MNWDRVSEIIDKRFPFKNVAMKQLIESLPRIADSRASVLIQGESGTGKEIIAKLIHRLGSRSSKRFVAVNCAAIPENLLESELFGHEKGAFTGAHSSRRGLFQEAEGGTVFLDEIGDMPIQLQAKLLRVLQDKAVTPVGSSIPRAVDFRLISATHQDLKLKTREGKFRLDLLYRLNVVPLHVPPLRERKEDIPYLIETFLNSYSRQYSNKPPTISSGAMEILVSRYWEGNVRELENFIERLLITHGHLRTISVEHLAEEAMSVDFSDFSFPSKLISVDDLIAKYIMHVFKEVHGHQGKASEILGISRRTIYRKIKAMSGKVPRELQD